MKHNVFFIAAIAAALLVSTFGVPAVHAVADPEAVLGGSFLSIGSHDAIGTGSMSDVDRHDPAAATEDVEYSIEEGASIGPHNVLGTGSMLPETGNASDAGISGLGGLTRSDVDFP